MRSQINRGGKMDDNYIITLPVAIMDNNCILTLPVAILCVILL